MAYTAPTLRGANGFVGLGEQSAALTAVTPAVFAECDRITVSHLPVIEPRPSLKRRNGVNYNAHQKVASGGTLALSGPLTYTNHGLWLKAALWSKAATVAGPPNVHKARLGTSPLYLTAEVNPSGDLAKAQVITGWVINELRLIFPMDGYARIEASGPFLEAADFASATSETIPTSAVDVKGAHVGTATVNSVDITNGLAKEIRVIIQNNLEERRGVGRFFASAMNAVKRRVHRAEIDYEAESSFFEPTRDDLLAQTARDIVLQITADSDNIIDIRGDNGQIVNEPALDVQDAGVLSYTVEYELLGDVSTDAIEIDYTNTNTNLEDNG